MTHNPQALNKTITTLRTRVNDVLSNLIPTHIAAANTSAFANDTTLCDAMRYSCLDAGKRIRPLLVYATGLAFDAPLELCDRAACAVELIHCYSLIHDDLPAMDDDDLRRGKPTCHIAFDEATAILAGDALQHLAYDVIVDPNHPISATQKIAMVQALSKASGAQGIVGGQMLDMHAPQMKLTETDLTVIHSLKTGCLLSTAVKLGLISANVTDETTCHDLITFADKIGLAFQIQDDILDIESSTQTLGKPQGSDQKQNKATFPAVISLAQAKENALNLYKFAIKVIHKYDHKFDLLRHLAELIVKRIH